jgi:hypothetical protein
MADVRMAEDAEAIEEGAHAPLGGLSGLGQGGEQATLAVGDG